MPLLTSQAFATYQRLRRAELAAFRALLVAGIPLRVVQPLFDEKINAAWLQVQQEAETKKAESRANDLPPIIHSY